MPTIEFSLKDLSRLLGKKVNPSELEEALEFVKGEVDGLEGDTVKADMKDTNRPDLWSVEGIARELKGFYGLGKGVPEYKAEKSKVKAFVDPGLIGIRPKAAYAIVKNVKLDDFAIKQMIQTQEKIAMTYGRKRKEVAIGIFDYDMVEGDVYYKAENPSYEFVPLGYKVKMSLEEILSDHPKGAEYSHLLKGMKKYPLLVDSRGEVLSMPPIINSAGSGKVTENTKNLFIDVTGYDQETIDIALKILCANFIDRGGKCESVQICYKDEKVWTPVFKPKKISLDFNYLNKLSGTGFKKNEVLALLKKKRLNAKIEGNKIRVEYSDMRADVLHPVDIIEEVLIAYGYNKFTPLVPNLNVVGKESRNSMHDRIVRECCVGVGLQEVLTLNLSSKEMQQEKVFMDNELVEIANPVSASYSVFRSNIFPGLLEFLSKNKHNAFPQRVFEIGRVLELNPRSEIGVDQKRRVCCMVSDNTADFTYIRSLLDSVMNGLGYKHKLKESVQDKTFIEGRKALVSFAEGKGVIGEVSPVVLGAFGLENPVAFFEIEFI